VTDEQFIATMAAVATREFFASHGLKHKVTKTEGGSEVHSYTSDLGPETVVLTLIHGWPQSAYEYVSTVPVVTISTKGHASD
jgi:hypothetical protein